LDESITAEAETTDSEDGDEDVRAELARLAMTIPIDEVRDIVKYYTRRR
jgi:hypothetical protein